MSPKRITLGAVGAAALAALAAGCGGGGTSAAPQGSVAGKTANVSPAAQKAQIERNWTTFFAGSTPPSQKVKLLQNGQRFSALIKAEARSPMAKQTKATVSKVALHGTKATVVYTIDLAGKPALPNRTGTAVLVNGIWAVGDQSFCQLLGLQGGLPIACKSATG